MAHKVSTIVLKVDLGCSRCSDKIRTILCKYRERYQIQEEIFDEKNNTVTITSPFCPRELAKKLCCKAGNVIKCINIVDKKPQEKPKPVCPPAPPPPEKHVDPKLQPTLEKLETDDPPPAKPIRVCCGPCHEGCGGPPSWYDGCGKPPPPCYCGCGKRPPPCSCGCERPCHDGCGRPRSCYCGCERPPLPCSCGCERRPLPCYCGCGRSSSLCSGRCGRQSCKSPCSYFSEEDPSSCIIM